MWWYVRQISPSEIHVYPSIDEQEHNLSADRCNCDPEVRRAGSVRMIVHKRLGQTPLKPAFEAHWIS